MTIIAEARDYDQLMDGLRKRVAELQISMETIDRLAGLPDGYASKLFAPVPIKGLGKQSLGPTLGAMGLKLLIVVDDEAMARIAKRQTKRIEAQVRSGGAIPAKKRKKKSPLLNDTDWGRVMRCRQIALTSPKQRSDQARRAIRVRWRLVREAKKRGEEIQKVIEGPSGALPASGPSR